MGECQAVNLEVVGSNPTSGANSRRSSSSGRTFGCVPKNESSNLSLRPKVSRGVL